MRAALVGGERALGAEVSCADVAGARLAAGGGRALRVWRWGAGEGWRAAGEARAAHRHAVTAARWAAGGALLASGGVDGAARLWRAAAGGLVVARALAAPGAEAVRSLAWAGAGLLLVGHDDGALRVWRAASGALLARVAALEGALHALAPLAHDRLLLAACTHGVLKVYDLVEVCRGGEAGEAGEAPARVLQWEDCAHDMGVLCACGGEDGAGAATGGHDGVVRVWRVARAESAPLRLRRELRGHAAAVTALAWAGGALASASLDRTARLWQPAGGACLLVLQAHPRYLTCLALDPRLRFLVTGSNDKSFRTWALGAFTVDDDLEPPCDPAEHFALGDLEGIAPVEDEGEAAGAGAEADESGARLVWAAPAHAGAINCIAVSGDLLASASSDGTVKVWRREADALTPEHTLEGHRYPVLAADFGPGGTALLTAGLDGCAILWDVATGVAVRSLGAAGGGGGVRGARLAGARALLATDEGVAAVWEPAEAEARVSLAYEGHAEAVTCCAWSADGVLAATGAASGELRVLAPPRPGHLHHDSQAHDLGVLSCDFAPPSVDVELPPGGYLLATAGCDSSLKLWIVRYHEESTSASVELWRAVCAHGGAVWSSRWGAGLLVSGGEDGWARAWRVRAGRVEAAGAARVRGAGGALAVHALPSGELVVGALGGELAVWRLPAPDAALDLEDDLAPRFWAAAGVARWLRDYVLRPPAGASEETAAAVERRARAAPVTGARLLDDDVESLARDLGLDEEEGASTEERLALRARLLSELEWLRRAPSAADEEAPHWARCGLSHAVLRDATRAADGHAYERATVRGWVAAHAPPAPSPLSGRALLNAALHPNLALRDRVRAFLARRPADGPDEPSDGDPLPAD